MTYESDPVARAVLLAELAKADEQIVNAEKSMLAARVAIHKVRAALALAGPRFDLVQESGRPADHEIERRFLSPQGDGGDDAD